MRIAPHDQDPLNFSTALFNDAEQKGGNAPAFDDSLSGEEHSDLEERENDLAGQDVETDSPNIHSDLLRHYLEHIGTRALLRREEEYRLACLVAQGDFGARQKMIEHNLRLVVFVAMQCQNKRLPLLDVIAEGNCGLIHAVDKFDPHRGCRFSTYAIWWIRASISSGLACADRTIRLPVHIRSAIKSVLKAKSEIESRADGEDAPLGGIGEKTGYTKQRVEELLAISQETASLDATRFEAGEMSLVDLIVADEAGAPDTMLEKSQLTDMVLRHVATLPTKQLFVIRARFGLWASVPQTLAEIAAQMNLTQERVRQIQMQALSMLRQSIRKADSGG